MINISNDVNLFIELRQLADLNQDPAMIQVCETLIQAMAETGVVKEGVPGIGNLMIRRIMGQHLEFEIPEHQAEAIPLIDKSIHRFKELCEWKEDGWQLS